MARYAITIFLSAFLLFQVQPLIGKFILPWFGGSPGVWTTCMLFFQVVLLAGYSYAHLLSSRLPGRAQTATHVTLLAVSLWFLPIMPDVLWKTSAVEDAPVVQIMALLAVTIGLPYFLLSSTGPLLQESFRRETGRAPYRLYSLSNIGSLLALLTYPFVFEPQLPLRIQIFCWSAAYVVFAVFCGWCAFGFARTAHAMTAVEGLETADVTESSTHKPSWGDVLMWLGLAACGSSLLLATTNQLCLEVSSVPFLWVLPLSIYLITFIICFDHERWYNRSVWLLLLAGAVMAAVYALIQGTSIGMWSQVPIYSGVLFVGCMVCHGELVLARPDPRHATLFYLMVSAGGALGGVLVGLLAPLVLRDFWEYQIALFAGAAMGCFAALRALRTPDGYPRIVWLTGGVASSAIAFLAGWYLTSVDSFNPETGERNLATTRNFYGVLRVNEEENFVNDYGPIRELIHGRIEHGFQYLAADKRRDPTTYYGRASGVGLAIEQHPRRSADKREDQNLKIGVIGLGCGTLAAYGRPGETIRFYEINPEVDRISQEYFTYRKDCEAKVEVVLGNARIRLEQELAAGDAQQFDVLAVDAFSSDAIPVHLLTRECVELYQRHLKPDGLLCLHVSNRFLDLTSVARGVAEAVGCECVRIDSSSDPSEGLNFCTWIILTNNLEFLEAPRIRDAISDWTEDDPAPIVWTDDYASLWQALDKS